ncbi:MAG: hypothetical protein HUU23_02120 [Caldilineales bacterium]|nr:hypothetical protein [Caldilineales bacterium]
MISELFFSLDLEVTEQIALWLHEISDLAIYPRSLATANQALFALGRAGAAKKLIIVSRGDQPPPPGFSGETRAVGELRLTLCPTSAAHAAALRVALDYTKPSCLGLATSVGCGDRLGLATPGHIQAVAGTGVRPILAQQSMRENARTGRTPQQVIDDATWGVFEAGWRQGYGADADHLKTTAHIDACVAAGYTFFTIDPGDHVQDEAHTAPPAHLADIVAALPWASLESNLADLRARYLGPVFDLDEGTRIAFDEETLLRAAGKYGRAIAHTARMARHLAGLTPDFDLEMSVDETETVTSAAEHFFIANELRRLGVRWVSLAPRYVGRFEKGVDYIGDLAAFEASLAQHAAIARSLGPYKLSIHSGSDKFSIYPAFARQTGGLVHLKTAGTSYLEALRVAAQAEPDLFRRILALGIERYPAERATYHVSADLARVPDPAAVADSDLPRYLDQSDARQVLHVTYGAALAAFGDDLIAVLRWHEEAHYAALAGHFRRHLQSFF